MTLNEYQALAQRTSRLPGGMAKVHNGAMGLCGETGEVMDHLKKYTYQGHAFDPNKLIDEAGDVLWYLAELAAGLRVGLEDIAEHNIAKFRRRYPDGFEVERSVYREGGGAVINNSKTKCMFCNDVDSSTWCRDFYRDMMDKSTMKEDTMCDYALEGYCGIAQDKGTDDFFLHFEFDAGNINGGIEISHCPKCGRALKCSMRREE